MESVLWDDSTNDRSQSSQWFEGGYQIDRHGLTAIPAPRPFATQRSAGHWSTCAGRSPESKGRPWPPVSARKKNDAVRLRPRSPAPPATNSDSEAGKPRAALPHTQPQQKTPGLIRKGWGAQSAPLRRCQMGNDMWQPGVVFLRADRFFGPQPSVTSTVKQGVLTNSPSRKRIRHNKLLLHKDVMSRKGNYPSRWGLTGIAGTNFWCEAEVPGAEMCR
jgi:hypothetical protein